ncbi:MAG: hypothetical protein RL698_2764 [Pseudomonadota bacterium]
MRRRCILGGLALALACLGSGAWRPRAALAACDLIPGVAFEFRGSPGTVDRPFAGPGDFVTLRPDTACGGLASALGTSTSQHVVSLVFVPPGDAPDRNSVVLLADDCTGISGEVAACGSDRPDVGRLRCVDRAAGSGLDLVGRCEGGSRNGQSCSASFPSVENGCGTGACRVDGLRFRFPSTDVDLPPAGDDLGLAGPVRVAVSRRGETSPCDLASVPCRRRPGLVACVDALFSPDTGCDSRPHPLFPGFTALPATNSYQDLCHDPVPPCTAAAANLRFTTDTDGNILLPMDWRGVLVGKGVPVARLLRGSTSVQAFPDDPAGAPIAIPGNDFLRSFAPRGALLPPVFDPQADLDAADEMTLFGSVDAPATVLRIERRAATHAACRGGRNDGLPCYDDAGCGEGGACSESTCRVGAAAGNACLLDVDCPGGECGPSLFDFSTRFAGGRGPVVVPRRGPGACQGGSLAGHACSTDADCAGDVCVGFRLVAKDPVPLEGLSQTRQVSSFVVPEAVQGRDLTGDGDTNDDAAVLVDRATGRAQPLGPGGSEGAAVVRVRQEPFSYPAVATSGDVVAFLQSELGQGYSDANSDDDIADSLLRIVRLGGGEISIPLRRAVDPSPRIDGRPLSISGGKVFVRSSERAMARQAAVPGVTYDGTAIPAWFPTGPFFLSDDAREVLFATEVDLSTSPNWFLRYPVHAWVHDVVTLRTERVSVRYDGGAFECSGTCSPGNPGPSLRPGGWSADGRFVVLESDSAESLPPGTDTNGVADVILRDRCVSRHEPVPGCTPSNIRLSITHDGGEPDGASTNPSISGDGRFVAFSSSATNLLSTPTTGRQVFVRDRCIAEGKAVTGCTPHTVIASVANDGSLADGGASDVLQITRDGSKVFFQSFGTSWDLGGSTDKIYVRDLVRGRTEPLAIAPVGFIGAESRFGGASDDGRYVAFASGVSLSPKDVNGELDVYVLDRETSRFTLVSVSTSGRVANGRSFTAFAPSPPFFSSAISGDGRKVVFESNFSTDAMPNLLPDAPSRSGVYRHDLDTGITELVSRGAGGVVGDRSSDHGVISRSGGAVAFQSNSDNLFEGAHTRSLVDMAVRTVDADDPLGVDAALFPDGLLDDTVLEAVDLASGSVATLCPAERAVTAAGSAAFLRPESKVGSGACPGGSLNGDDDMQDRVVQWWSPGSSVRNLGCAAKDLAASATLVAAVVPEAGQGGADLNGDGDASDDVVKVMGVSGAAGSAGCESWQNTAQAADAVAVCGALVAFITPEAAQAADLNGDGDLQDRVLQAWDPATGSLVAGLAMAADEMVCNESLLAFRSPEAARSCGGAACCDLNGDGDCADGVLQVYDVAARSLVNSRQAVTPCALEACDPRTPYRVLQHSVKFLTLESEQGMDLNRDGDVEDLVVQTFNMRVAQSAAAAAARAASGSGGRAPARGATAPVTMLPETVAMGSLGLGVCTNDGSGCASDADCEGSGSCYLPPGGCIRDLGTFCRPSGASCGDGQYCHPTGLDAGTCRRVEPALDGSSECVADAECAAPAKCNPSGQAIQRLVDPLAEGGGATVFTGVGQCMEEVRPLVSCSGSGSGSCRAGEVCGRSGFCERPHGTCVTGADCPAGASCEASMAVATCNDLDGDEVCDVLDNCATAPNPGQEDVDGNGRGDACDASCGNGIVEPGEACDDGNLVAGDGCEPDCRVGLAGGCPAVPMTVCRRPVVAGKASLAIKNALVDSDDSLSWKWMRGAATALQSFGDPTAAGGAVRLCLYDGAGSLAMGLSVATGGRCGGAACWKAVGRTGFGFKDLSRSQHGVERIGLRAGGDGKASVTLKARGAGIGVAALPFAMPVTVQVVVGGECWGAVFDGAGLNRGDAFVGKGQ